VQNGGEAIKKYVYCTGSHVLPATNKHTANSKITSLRVCLGNLIVIQLFKKFFGKFLCEVNWVLKKTALVSSNVRVIICNSDVMCFLGSKWRWRHHVNVKVSSHLRNSQGVITMNPRRLVVTRERRVLKFHYIMLKFHSLKQ
jgi:hypothetical protein